MENEKQQELKVKINDTKLPTRADENRQPAIDFDMYKPGHFLKYSVKLQKS